MLEKDGGSVIAFDYKKEYREFYMPKNKLGIFAEEIYNSLRKA